MSSNDLGNLGFMILAVLYFFQMVGSIFGPSISKRIGLIWSFVLGCLSLSIFVFINILPAWRSDKIVGINEDD